MCEQMQRFPLRRGQMVVFDGGQLHCNFGVKSNHFFNFVQLFFCSANRSPNVRLIQFIRQIPATEANLSVKPDRCKIKKGCIDGLLKGVIFRCALSCFKRIFGGGQRERLFVRVIIYSVIHPIL